MARLPNSTCKLSLLHLTMIAICRKTHTGPYQPHRRLPGLNPRRYAVMSEEEIKLDRYAKFRKLGQFQEFVVKGGDWRTALAERAAVSERTRAGEPVLYVPICV